MSSKIEQINSFDLIASELSRCNNINDKEIILGIYYDMFNVIITSLSMKDTYDIDQYKEYLVRTMFNVIKLSKSRLDTVSCESFLKNLIYYLNINDLAKDKVVSSVIKYFQVDFDKLVKDDKEMVNNINLVYKDISFIDRIRIIVRYKNYISDLTFRLTTIYGVDHTYEFVKNLNDYLNSTLMEIMSLSDNLDTFTLMLKSYTKDKFKKIFLENEFDFFNINSGFIYELMKELNDSEAMVFKLYFFYKLAGFDSSDFDILQINDDVLANELGIDTSLCNRCLVQMQKKANKLRFKMILGLGKTRKRKK